MTNNSSFLLFGRALIAFLFLCGATNPQSLYAQVDNSLETREDQNQILRQLINPTTIMVAQIDTQRLKASSEIQKLIASHEELQLLIKWLDSFHAALGPMADHRIYFAVDIPFSTASTPIRFSVKKPPQLDMTKLNEAVTMFRFSAAIVQGDFVSASPLGNMANSNSIAIGNDILPRNLEVLPIALETVKEMPIQVLVLPPEYLWSTYRDLMPRLPDQFGGGSTATILDGFDWSTIGVDPTKANMQITIQSKSKAAAESFALELPKLWEYALKILPQNDLLTSLRTMVKAGRSTVIDDRIEITLSGSSNRDAVSALMTQLGGSIFDPLKSRVELTRIEKIALAILEYESEHETFPPSAEHRNPNGKSNLSWRVHLLPYLGQQQLYSEFKLDEPWDSEHNGKLLVKMPDIYRSLSNRLVESKNVRPGHTNVVAPVGEATIFGGLKPVAVRDIVDGTVNTILFVEVKPEYGVPWTAPSDYSFPINNPIEQLDIGADGKFIAAFADGSVRLLPSTLSKEKLIFMFKINDGNMIDF